MKVLVQPHDFALGGSQLNAVDLAAGVAALGHEVYVACRPGPISDRAAAAGLELLELPEVTRRPSPAISRTLRRWARDLRLDILHGYEWPPGLETWAAASLGRVASVTTVYSMEVAPFLPRSVDLIVGTHQIADRAAGFGHLHVIEPPVNVVSDSPGAGGAALRADLGIEPDEAVIVMVGRLVPELKLEGVLGAIDAMERLPTDQQRATLLIVGDGSSRAEVEYAAERANARAGRHAVRVLGEMQDPRAAYDAADIALGMGGSALRALAFGKPLVVQGERGFWRTLTPTSHRVFSWGGWYGVGDGGGSADALVDELIPLVRSPQLRWELGAYGLKLVRDNYSLETSAITLESIYREALLRPSAVWRDAPRSGLGVLSYKTRRKVARLFGRARPDDFNAVSDLPNIDPPNDWSAPARGVRQERHEP